MHSFATYAVQYAIVGTDDISIEPEGVLDYQVPKRTLLAGLRSSPEGVLDTDANRALSSTYSAQCPQDRSKRPSTGLLPLEFQLVLSQDTDTFWRH